MLATQNFRLSIDQDKAFNTPQLEVEKLLSTLSLNPHLIGWDKIALGSQEGNSKYRFLDFYVQKEGKTYVGEIKNYPPITKEMLELYLTQLSSYIANTEAEGGILVIPSFVSQITKDYFTKHDIQVWDIDYINYLKEIRNQIYPLN